MAGGPYVRVFKVSYDRRVMMILHEGWWFRKLCEKMKRRIPCSISEAPNKTNSPPPRLVANKSFSPVSARAQFPKISNTNQIFLIIERVHEVCSFEKSNFHLKSICQKVRLNLWQLGLLDFGRTTKYFQQLSQQNREIQNTPIKGLWSRV